MMSIQNSPQRGGIITRPLMGQKFRQDLEKPLPTLLLHDRHHMMMADDGFDLMHGCSLDDSRRFSVADIVGQLLSLR